MSEKDPATPSASSFESKLNVMNARINDMRAEFDHLKETVEDIEELYTSPLPPSLDRSVEFGNKVIQFTAERNGLVLKYKSAFEYLTNTIGGDPENDAPERIVKTVELLKELMALQKEVEQLETYVFSLKFPRPPESPKE